MMPLKSRKEDERLRESDHQTEELSFTYEGSSQYKVSVTGIAIFRLRHGQIVEEWLITDQLGAREGWKETPSI
jgi:hypothetical protein